MQLFVLFLNKVESLEAILEEMLAQGISGATILDSTGMMRVLDTEDPDLPMFGMIRHLLDPERKKNKTMMAVVRDEQVQPLIDIINKATGGLNSPDTGIVFTVPTLRTEGLGKK